MGIDRLLIDNRNSGLQS